MATTNSDRLDDILNDSNGSKPKKKTSDPAPPKSARERARSKSTKDRGQSAGEAQIGQLAERNRQVANKITALNAKQTASFIVQDYVDGTFMGKTLNELDLMLEGFQSAFEEGLTLEGTEESDPLLLHSASGSLSSNEPEQVAACPTA
ncbi:hypothetical protein IQ249_15050 [Lusitaniella coriacea LEGE 07157]|uniref:Uncharacterized protein n=1 Tax=Lusitaniella coriacea LEGE 07157 TaxID=945747 RepID=A0A8J7DXM8_9CYAN|nr:hypothetical protein [Lusitaniella coriacea]MBE9117216.1 hypothetical protein [Lusitaniella coriacea LEGE 07157]